VDIRGLQGFEALHLFVMVIRRFSSEWSLGPIMRHLAFFLLLISSASGVIAEDDDVHYLVVHQETDPRFITSIERVGGCKIPGEPLPVSKLRLPPQLYPATSAARHKEGTIKMQFIFDHDWCVRKASVLESTGYWRLDEVSLKVAMTMKFKPPIIKQYVDGEPAIVFPIGWGASQHPR
jgi:TonB family protein